MHWKKPWCWERLRAGGEGDDRGWDGWVVSPVQWTWVWASSGGRWWIGKPGVVQSKGLQRIRHDWVTELKLNWTELQHARLPCPSLSTRAFSHSCPLSVMPSNHLVLCLPLLLPPSLFPRIRVYPNESGGQSIGASASASVLPKNIQSIFFFFWFLPLTCTTWLKI